MNTVVNDQVGQLLRLDEAVAAIDGVLELEPLVGEIVRQACDVLKGGRCALLVPDESGERLLVRAISPEVQGVERGRALETEIPLEEGAGGEAFETRDVVLARDFPLGRDVIGHDGDHLDEPVVAYLPLVWLGCPVGVLALDLGAPDQRAVRQPLALMNRFAGHASAALDRAKRYEDARQRVGGLEEANSRLLERDQLRRELLSTMSHELRTPLMAIEGYAHMLLSHPASQLTGEQQEFVEGIRQSGRQQLAMINDLLDFSRIEAGRLELDIRAQDLNDVLNRVLQTIRPMAVNKAQTLSNEVPGYMPLLKVDGRRLYQILLNLVSNAVKFTPQGGQVIISAEELPPGEVQVTVTDTGIGIPEEEQELIFERFRRGRTPDDEELPGTGLGLAISKHLVELHGGRIWVESKPGEGSTFGFTVPTFFLTPQPRATHVLLTSRTSEENRYLDTLCHLVAVNLASGYRFEYVGSADVEPALAEAFLAADIDLEPLVARGQVILLHDRAPFQRGQFVDFQLLMEGVFEFYKEAVSEGYVGACLAVDMTWLYAGERRLSQVLGYEAQLEGSLSKMRGPLTVICHYDLDELAEDVGRELLRLHAAEDKATVA